MRRSSIEQVVVDVERVDRHTTTPYQHLAQATVLGRSERSVQGSERGSRARDAIATGPENIACHEDLIAAEPRGRDVEVSSGARSPSNSGVYAAEFLVEGILQLAHSDVVHPNLTDLRNHDKPFARDRQ